MVLHWQPPSMVLPHTTEPSEPRLGLGLGLGKGSLSNNEQRLPAGVRTITRACRRESNNNLQLHAGVRAIKIFKKILKNIKFTHMMDPINGAVRWCHISNPHRGCSIGHRNLREHEISKFHKCFKNTIYDILSNFLITYTTF